MNHPKTALVTGGNGFLGSHLVRFLHERGYWVRVLVLAGTPVDSILGYCDEIVEGDICNPASLPQATQDIDVVFHLAALVTDWGASASFVRVNVQGTEHVLQAAIQSGCRRFVHMSSLAVHQYRDILDGDETCPRDATTPAYAVTKKQAEDVVLAHQRDIETVILRPGLFPYGPGDTQNLPRLFASFEAGQFGFVGGGHAQFCTSYVDNLVEGMLLAAEKPEAIGQTFVLCDNQPISWQQFATVVAQQLGTRKPRWSVPYFLLFPLVWLWEQAYRLLRIRQSPTLTCYRLRVVYYHLVFSNAKARRLLDYQPRIDFEEGMKRTIRWYRSLPHPHTPGSLPKDESSEKTSPI